MTRRALSVGALVLGTLLHAEGALAKTVVVSKGVNCWPQVADAPYTTIQVAVDAVPAGSTIVVCPGTYPEQLRITKNLTITGALRDGTDPVEQMGNSGEAKIVAPPGGLIVIPGTGNVAAQILATGVPILNVTNLTIDGTDIGCPLAADGLPAAIAGIALDTVGIVGTSSRGTVSKTVVHNQIGYCPNAATGLSERSFMAQGMLVSGNSLVTIDSNSISNIDLSGVLQTGGVSKITNNAVGLGWHGIVLLNVTTKTASTISLNTVSSFSTGIYLDGSSNAQVTLNTLSNWTGDAIALTHGASTNTISSNTIVDAWHGIYLNLGSSKNIVKSNIIVRSVQIGIVDTYSGGGNQITLNTINQSPIGIFSIAPADDVILPNTFYTTAVLTSTGPYVP